MAKPIRSVRLREPEPDAEEDFEAVLVVYVDGVAWLLDNQIRDVVRADTVRHYRAIYSVNETTWWLHRY